MKKSTMAPRLAALIIDFALLILMAYGINTVLDSFDIDITGMKYITGALLFVLYFPLFETSPMSATLGMKIMGIYVTFGYGKHTFVRIIKRFLWAVFLCLPFGIGLWYGFYDKNGETLYDFVSKSKVISGRRSKTQKGQPCIYHVGKDVCYDVRSGGSVLGRNPAICDIVMSSNEPGVSRCHCFVTYNRQTDMFLIEDLNSSYGTYLGDRTRISPGKIAALNNGERFFVGGLENEFTVGFSE